MGGLQRAIAVLLAIVLVVGGAVGVVAWRRWQQVVLERSESKTRAAELRMKTSLTLDEACWIAKDWYHHGKGLAGFRPLVECEGSVEVIPGGLKLNRVLTESELLQGRHVHSSNRLCARPVRPCCRRVPVRADPRGRVRVRRW